MSDDWFDAPIVLAEEVKVKKESFFFKFITDISYDKEYLLTEENEKEYSPYMVNRFLSMDVSTAMYAQEMNLHYGLDKDMHYEYLINAVRKKKRYFKYVKDDKQENLDIIAKFYNISHTKAKEVASLHSQADIDVLVSKMGEGGSNASEKRKRKAKR